MLRSLAQLLEGLDRCSSLGQYRNTHNSMLRIIECWSYTFLIVKCDLSTQFRADGMFSFGNSSYTTPN
jgi:hypothetical protein